MKLLQLIAIVLAVLSIGVIFTNGHQRTVKEVAIANEETPQILYDRINYLDYSDQTFSSSLKYGKTLLFFAATTWCSNCAEIDKEIKVRNSELPKDVTILKVDYDRDAAMKAKYAVTQQTTLILFDKNGKETKRWIGTDFNNLLANL